MPLSGTLGTCLPVFTSTQHPSCSLAYCLPVLVFLAVLPSMLTIAIPGSWILSAPKRSWRSLTWFIPLSGTLGTFLPVLISTQQHPFSFENIGWLKASEKTNRAENIFAVSRRVLISVEEFSFPFREIPLSTPKLEERCRYRRRSAAS